MSDVGLPEDSVAMRREKEKKAVMQFERDVETHGIRSMADLHAWMYRYAMAKRVEVGGGGNVEI